MPDSDRTENVPAPPAATKKPYSAPAIVECGSVAKLTMGKGSTSVEQGLVVKRKCL